MEQTELFGNNAMGSTMYLGKYDAYEVMSALVKSIRLGKVDDALYWLEVMIKGGAGLGYIARRLLIESQESGYGAEPAIYAQSVFYIISVGKSHAQDAIFQLVVYLCNCKKWWEVPEMRETMRKWFKTEKEVIQIQKNEKRPRPMPEYAIDKHTRRGKAKLNNGERVDERFSGSEKGIFSMMELFERNGRLHEDDSLTLEQERNMRRFLYED